MKIIPLKRNGRVSSCNSYLILGDWNRLEDVNTIIDPGCDDALLGAIERLATGFGKIPVAQVILTRNHFDHGRSAALFRERFGARVLAFCGGPGIDQCLGDGQFIAAGDDVLEVLHTPGHSPDSISLYAPAKKALFSGDLHLQVERVGGIYGSAYVEGLFKIACRDIETIYSGHGEPLAADCQELIVRTVRNVCRSTVLEEGHDHACAGARAF